MAGQSTGRDSRVCVGALGGPVGLKGEVKLTSFTEDPETIATLGPLASERGERTFTITGLRPAKGGFAAKLAGVPDRTAAERLPRTRLYVDRAALPEPDPDEDAFYHADLIGLAAVDTGGTVLGTVRAVHDFGAGDVLELFRPGAKTTVMIPFTKAAVPLVEIASGRVIVDPLVAGLLPTGDEPEPAGPDDGAGDGPVDGEEGS